MMMLIVTSSVCPLFLTSTVVVVTVVQVNNVLGFERTMGGLARLGYLKVSCIPVVSYESFAQFLGVDLSLASNPNRPLPKENLYHWCFELGYTGETTTTSSHFFYAAADEYIL
jgi:hypothetical protein